MRADLLPTDLVPYEISPDEPLIDGEAEEWERCEACSIYFMGEYPCPRCGFSGAGLEDYGCGC